MINFVPSIITGYTESRHFNSPTQLGVYRTWGRDSNMGSRINYMGLDLFNSYLLPIQMRGSYMVVSQMGEG